jgi:SNF2 family DNA or RNA helicase
MSTLKRHNLVRWYGEDSPLVGVITAVENGRLHVRFDNGRKLQFAHDGGALERLLLAPGAPAVLPGTGERVTVGEAREVKGVLFYEVTLASGAAQHVLEDALRPAVLSDPVDRMRAGELDRARSVNLRLAGTRLRFAFEQDELASLQASRVEIKAHQVGVVHRVSRSYPHRFLLADEVGLGKTIEAALIIRELKARGVATRVLVLAPSGLVTQWQSELKHKFNQVFADYRGPLVKVLEGQNPGENVWTLSDNVASSTTFAAYNDERIAEIARAGWDLIVVDEAHHARRTRRADKQESTRLYRLLERLVDPEHGHASSMLLLTATPMQLDPFEIYSLIELLDPTLFASPDDFERHRASLRGLNATVEALHDWASAEEEEREEALDATASFLDRPVDEVAAELASPETRSIVIESLNDRHRLSQVMIRNRKKVVGGFMPRVAAVWELDLTPQERAAYDALTTYTRDGFARSQAENRMALGFVMVMFQKLATSSSRALQNSLLRRMDKLEQKLPPPAPAAVAAMPLGKTDDDDEEFDDAVEETGEDTIAAFAGGDDDAEATWREVQEIERIVRLAEQIPIDTKTKVLLERLEEIREREPGVRVLVFTQFRGTQEELKERIPSPWSVHLFHGGLDPREKDAEVARFRDEPGPQVLVSTEAGGEGRNLQFSHWLINYDLPWNPMKVEQRIGRVDRIGQKSTVMVASFSTRGTVEERVVEVLSRRIGVFEETRGSEGDRR